MGPDHARTHSGTPDRSGRAEPPAGETRVDPVDAIDAIDVGRTFQVSVTRRIAAPAEAVYGVFADYRVAHPRVLPPSVFLGLDVEEGGQGAGTVVLVRARFAGRVQAMRGYVTEPEPGRSLVETYPEDRIVTTFRIVPDTDGGACTASIGSVLPQRRAPLGWIERWIAGRVLRRLYAEELDLVAAYLGAPD